MQTVTPINGANIAILYENGRWDSAAKVGTAISSYTRRIGAGSTISSQEGTDSRFRPVSHIKETYTGMPLSTLDQYLYGEYQRTLPYSSSETWKEYIYRLAEDVHAKRYRNFTAACDSVNLSIATVPWSSLSSTALLAMLPSFQKDNSWVNFVLELKDFKRIAESMSSGFLSKWEKLQSLVGYVKRDKPAAKLAKMYLSYSYAWAPLYKDLESLIKSMTGIKRRFDELVLRQKKPQQSYWGTTIAGSQTTRSLHSFGNDGPTGGWVGPFLGKYYWNVYLNASSGIRYSATVRYRFTMPDVIGSTMGQIKAALDILGVSPNPGIIWNAIPFTFVIDYFVNVGRFLNSMRVDNLDFKTEISDFCHSVKYERSIEMEMGGNTYNWQTGYKLLGMSTVDYCTKSVYERRVGFPDFSGAIQTSGLNPREFSLLGALVGANAKRLGRRR